MSIELINKITFENNEVYVSTHSSNDTDSFHLVKSLFLTEAYKKEGEEGLDKAFISMCLDNWEISGSHSSVEGYKKAINKAIYEKEFNDIRNQYDELSDKVFDIANGLGEYKNLSKESRDKLYIELKPQVETMKDKKIEYVLNILREIRKSKEISSSPESANILKKYNVKVTETLERTIEVEAETVRDAISKVQEMYDNSEIVLDDTDYQGVEIDAAYTEYAKDVNNDNDEITLEELQELLDDRECIDDRDI